MKFKSCLITLTKIEVVQLVIMNLLI